MQTQEKQRVLTQLKSLRQQSLSEYLGTNLQSLANRQVIEDILSKFISLHEDDFLTNVSNSIVEVKEQYRAIKKQLKEKEEQENLLKLKIENELAVKYETEMEEFFQKWLELQQLSFEKSAQKSPSKGIKKLFDQLQTQKSKTQQLQSAKNSLQKQQQTLKNSFSQQLSSKQNEIKTLSQNLRTLQNRIKFINQTMDSKELLSKSLQEQVYQKHIKLQQTILMVKEMEDKLVNSKEMMDFLENKACAMREENVKLKHQIQMMEKDKQKMDVLMETMRKECKQLEVQKNSLEEKEKKLLESLESFKVKVQHRSNENTELNNQISLLKTQIQTLQDELKQLQKSSEKSIEALCNEKTELCKQKDELLSQISRLDSKLKQTLSQLSQTTQQKQSLVKQVQQKQVMMKNYLDQKDQQIKLIEEELRLMKEEFEEKQEQEKQYELYLQEIVELRQKIKFLTPAKYQTSLETDCFGRPNKLTNKRTKIYFLLTQVQNKFIQLKSERSELVRSIAQQVQSMKDYTNKAVGLILAKSTETKVKCEYCELARTHNVVRSGIAKNVRNQQTANKSMINCQETYQHEQEMQKTREFSYKPSSILSSNNQNQGFLNRPAQHPETTPTKPTGSRGITKNIRQLNQKMKAINQENSIYQMHLSRLLSESSLQ